MRSYRTVLAVGFAVASLASGAMPSYADNKEVGPGDAGRVVVKSDEWEKNKEFAFGPAGQPVLRPVGPRLGDPGSDGVSSRWLCESPYAQCMFDFKPVGAQEDIVLEIGRVRRALVESRNEALLIRKKIEDNLREIQILVKLGEVVEAKFLVEKDRLLTIQWNKVAEIATALLDELKQLISRVEGIAGHDTLRQRTCLDSYRLCRKAVEASMRLGGLGGPRPPAQ
jgi:hypothetical protein